MANENLTAETWITGVLDGDAAGVEDRIYEAPAPRGAVYPLILISHQAGHDVRGVGPHRIMSDLLYTIRVVDKVPNYSSLKSVAETIDTLLQGASGDTTDGTVIGCVREQPFKMIETRDNEQYRHLGGIYRLWVQ